MAEKPFPTNEPEVNLLLQTMATHLPGLVATLDIPAADGTFVVKNAANYQYLVTIAQDIDDSTQSFTAFKRALFKGDPLAAAPATPVLPVLALPNPAETGIEPTLKGIIKRIKASAAYNETIGEQLGLVDSGDSSFNPNDLTPELKFKTGNASEVTITFSKKGQDAMRVEFKRKADTEWLLAGVYLSSPATHAVPSVPPDEPESRQYRGILLKGNDPIGNYSPIYTVVTTP